MTKEYHISVIPGDGTGPEVVEEGIKILQTLADKFDFKLKFTHYNIGGDHYNATGEVLPENILESIWR